VSAYDWFGSMAFQPLGLAVWGPVAGVLGVGVSLWLAFALQVSTTLLLLAIPDIRRVFADALPTAAREVVVA
jgi:hypothetical protein